MTKNEGKAMNILALAMKCREVGSHIFTDYAPHVNSLNIWGYEGVFGDYKERIISEIVYLDWEDAENKLISIENYLIGLIAKSEF